MVPKSVPTPILFFVQSSSEGDSRRFYPVPVVEVERNNLTTFKTLKLKWKKRSSCTLSNLWMCKYFVTKEKPIMESKCNSKLAFKLVFGKEAPRYKKEGVNVGMSVHKDMVLYYSFNLSSGLWGSAGTGLNQFFVVRWARFAGLLRKVPSGYSKPLCKSLLGFPDEGHFASERLTGNLLEKIFCQSCTGLHEDFPQKILSPEILKENFFPALKKQGKVFF